jgi:hypothetical protein
MASLAAPIVETAVSEPLSWAEICATYPDQWVGLVDVVRNSKVALDLRAARVVSHGANPADVLRQLRPLRPHYEDAAHFFTGRIQAPFPRFL